MAQKSDNGSGQTDAREAIIQVRGLTVGFGSQTVLENLDLDVFRGEVLGVVGASGSGKSVLLRAIVGLLPRRAGSVVVFGKNIGRLSERARTRIERRCGVLFQDGALFSALTVLQNIQVPMREHLDLSQEMMDELAAVKLGLVGLPQNAGAKFPAELSGGMRKRAGLARALALDPEIVFLDEPTSGLDPISAADFDDLVGKLQQTLGLTVFMVTHDLDSLYAICDRIAVLGDKHVLVEGDMKAMLAFDHPWVSAYFKGPRARAASA